ncbi:hypothetical protein RG963_09090 [Methanosarcina sp. Z-7115]|uniref:ADP-ribosylglycohydrolase n=1 Tax=Methanosarcina baikalica TaxID=3073890 RepID=A0ABU2D1R4_9EURY|nr:hypothetical protein [Methanosarcina sp. Z-7115]MDR7665923.1 hypothetical protein [Methanosarcina sp. Z-7115]
MHSKPDGIEKKLRGYLFGTACGDALGRPVDILPLKIGLNVIYIYNVIHLYSVKEQKVKKCYFLCNI